MTNDPEKILNPITDSEGSEPEEEMPVGSVEPGRETNDPTYVLDDKGEV